ncbi:MAG: trigger factor, peptidyl-prolyl cis-trans isomerase, partial [Actinomycetota bacterium]
REAVTAENIRTLGRPEIVDQTLPSEVDFSGDLVLVIETDIRPEFEIPKYEGLKVTVEEAEITADAVEDELLQVRTRFGTLVTVDRPATKGDFVTLDLTATIGGKVVDTAGSISYEVGSGDLIDGLDEAVDTLTAGETTTFKSTLLGGDHAGEDAEVEVTIQTVKEREIPEADDEFAQVASQFDTIGELRADLRTQLEKRSVFDTGAKARQALLDELLSKVTIPVPAGVIEQEVHRHLEQEGRLEDDAHRAEVTESTEKSFRIQILLDALAEKEEVQVGQDELLNYMMQSAQQYGMDVNEFIQIISSNGQVPAMVGEVARSKALSVALSKAKVVNQKGKDIDLSEFTAGATATVGDIIGDDHDGHDHDDHAGHNH